MHGKQFETLELVNDPADFETPVPETTILNQLPTDAGNISETIHRYCFAVLVLLLTI